MTEVTDFPIVSTGQLPSPEVVQELVAEAHRRHASNADGSNSDVYPTLARVTADLCGICVVGTAGRVYSVGDVDHRFSAGERVIDAATCHFALAVMTIASLYEASGNWLYEVGLPGKSGIGGGIVTVSPGKGGLGTFAPPLDSAGNSVKGQLVARFLSRRLGLDLFVSAPARSVETAAVSTKQRG